MDAPNMIEEEILENVGINQNKPLHVHQKIKGGNE